MSSLKGCFSADFNSPLGKADETLLTPLQYLTGRYRQVMYLLLGFIIIIDEVINCHYNQRLCLNYQVT